ncbi:MAG TPA: hypothetical protein VGG07_25180 [Solirubrobacteraceae bacterium]
MRQLITRQVDKPAEGADWTFVPSAGDSVRLLAITAKLVTSSASASRAVVLQAVDENGLILDAFPTVDAQVASKTVLYVWDDASTMSSAGSDSLTFTQAVPKFWLPPQTTIKTVTALIDTDDQWSNIVATFHVTDALRWAEAEALIDQLGSMLSPNG